MSRIMSRFFPVPLFLLSLSCRKSSAPSFIYIFVDVIHDTCLAFVLMGRYAHDRVSWTISFIRSWTNLTPHFKLNAQRPWSALLWSQQTLREYAPEQRKSCKFCWVQWSRSAYYLLGHQMWWDTWGWDLQYTNSCWSCTRCKWKQVGASHLCWSDN